MILYFLLLLATLAHGERPLREMSHYRNATHFLPDMCCQWCGQGAQWEDYEYVFGRCIYNPDKVFYPEGSAPVELEAHLAPEHPPVIHHPKSCCFFCGDYPGEYNFHIYGNETAHEGYCKRKDSFDDIPQETMFFSPHTRCIFCKAFVGLFKNYRSELPSNEFFKKLMTFCNSSVLKGACINYIYKMQGLIAMLLDSDHSINDICSVGLGLCPEEVSFDPLQTEYFYKECFYAPTSIKSLLDPTTEGIPLTTAQIMDMPNIDYTTLRKMIVFDARTPEEHLRNLKFAARYSLIYNRRECGCTGHGHGSLIKRTGVVDGWIWRCADCKKGGSTVTVSVRDRSFMSLFDKPIDILMRLAQKWCHSPYESYDSIQSQLGIARPFLVHVYGIFRDLAQSWFEREALRTPLGGHGKIVEIDESVMFRRKYHRGKVLRKQVWVFGMVERKSNRVGMFIVKRRNAATLLPLIAKHVAPGTKVVSDGWAAYRGIPYLQQQFDHKWVNHKLHFVDPTDPELHTQSVESMWGAAKKIIKRIQNLSTDELKGYLCQYMFRRRYQKEKMVNKLITEMSLYDPDDENLSDLDENSEDDQGDDIVEE